MSDFTLPLSVQEERAVDAPRLYTGPHHATKPAPFDWDALTPTCSSCGRKSGRLDDASVCPACRAPEEQPAVTVKSKRATKPKATPRPRAKKAQGPKRPIGRPRIHPIREPKPRRDEAAMVAAYKAGQTAPQIAREHGCIPRTVRQIVVKHGVELRDDRVTHSGGQPKNYPEELVEQVRALYYDEQLSRPEVARRLDVGLKTVVTIMNRHNMRRRQGVTGNSDGAVALKQRLTDLRVTSREVKDWAIDQHLLDTIHRGMPPLALVEAWASAHPESVE